MAKGIFKVFILATAAAFVYIFYTLSATRVLNSYEELCITLGAADNSFARVLNPHGGSVYIELSGEGINCCHSRNAKLFEWIECLVTVERIYVDKTKVIHMH